MPTTTTIQKNARTLRKNSTLAERLLWGKLRLCQLADLRFRRQVPIGNFIVDFLCYEKNLIIELDGGQHNHDAVRIYDMQRTAWLEQQGYTVLRFWNNEVLYELENVVEHIWHYVHGSLDTPHPNPPPQGGREPAV
ncbi:MAG TPA: endonuclease domain-containing protein [Gammaproteobacteria bacterium]|nr:endonuclease domain-containing protein [Gammaproteobacteria bacterium]